MASELVEENERQEADILERLRVLLLPRDPNDEKNVIVGDSGGGGRRGGCPLCRGAVPHVCPLCRASPMAHRLLTSSETGIGGIKEVIFEVRGQGAYSRLKYEAGVHRVQRVPTTESSGRIHTRRFRWRCCRKRKRLTIRSMRTRTCASRSSARRGPEASRSTRPTRRFGSPTCHRPGRRDSG